MSTLLSSIYDNEHINMNTRDIATYLTIVDFCLSKNITIHYKIRQEEDKQITLVINGVSKLDQ